MCSSTFTAALARMADDIVVSFYHMAINDRLRHVQASGSSKDTTHASCARSSRRQRQVTHSYFAVGNNSGPRGLVSAMAATTKPAGCERMGLYLPDSLPSPGIPLHPPSQVEADTGVNGLGDTPDNPITTSDQFLEGSHTTKGSGGSHEKEHYTSDHAEQS